MSEEQPKKWKCNVITDSDGEYMVEFNDEIMEHLGIKDGDTIEWIDNKDGTWSIQKKQ